MERPQSVTLTCLSRLFAVASFCLANLAARASCAAEQRQQAAGER